jgi:hypothetical protein
MHHYGQMIDDDLPPTGGLTTGICALIPHTDSESPDVRTLASLRGCQVSSLGVSAARASCQLPSHRDP